MIVFDIETNGLLPELHTIHCIALQDLTGKLFNGKVVTANAHDGLTVEAAVKLLNEAETIIGHNIVGFDIPAIQKVFPWFKPKGVVRDTTLMSRLIFADMAEVDFKNKRKYPEMPGNLIGTHKLEAWGYRLGEWKGDYAAVMKERGLDPWAEWSREMDDYCKQDVTVTAKLWGVLKSKGFSEESIELEHQVATIIERQVAYGFLFDAERARELEKTLVKRRAELAAQLAEVFPPWQSSRGMFTPKVNNAKMGYQKGVTVERFETVVFNPSSRDHIANRLKAKYRWKPTEFTDGGKPKIDEDVLERLSYPEVPLILEYMMVEKRIGQLSEGKQAWFKSVKEDGRIHGRVVQNGAVTGRMTHSSPNMAQVPSVKKAKDGTLLSGGAGGFGAECRALFTVPPGKVLVGADASGLELRNLAHYMGRWDNGAYAKVILEGDIHTVNQTAAGLPTRDNAKTFIYAFLYGAGDEKIGSIVGKGRKAGGQLRERFLAGLPALGNLVDAVKHAAKERGYLIGLDGRILKVRSDHAALNTLLQSAGAIAMKKALVILDNRLQELGLVPGVHYEFVANVHDEWQIECDEDKGELVGQTAVWAINQAGIHYNFRCPLNGEYKIGKNWKETH